MHKKSDFFETTDSSLILFIKIETQVRCTASASVNLTMNKIHLF